MLFLSAQSMKVYNREIAVYRDLHSVVGQIRFKAGVRDDEIPICAPYFYHSHLDEVSGSGVNATMVVMEDLKTLGYRMVNKKVGCTVEEAMLTLTAIANYHALTIALVRSLRNPDDDKSLLMPDNLRSIIEGYAFIDMGFEVLGKILPTIVEALKILNHKEVVPNYYFRLFLPNCYYISIVNTGSRFS